MGKFYLILIVVNMALIGCKPRLDAPSTAQATELTNDKVVANAVYDFKIIKNDGKQGELCRGEVKADIYSNFKILFSKEASCKGGTLNIDIDLNEYLTGIANFSPLVLDPKSVFSLDIVSVKKATIMGNDLYTIESKAGEYFDLFMPPCPDSFCQGFDADSGVPSKTYWSIHRRDNSSSAVKNGEYLAGQSVLSRSNAIILRAKFEDKLKIEHPAKFKVLIDLKLISINPKNK